jgi:hypothetical protein
MVAWGRVRAAGHTETAPCLLPLFLYSLWYRQSGSLLLYLCIMFLFINTVTKSVKYTKILKIYKWQILRMCGTEITWLLQIGKQYAIFPEENQKITMNIHDVTIKETCVTIRKSTSWITSRGKEIVK